jgi:hypothetical protein
MTKKEECEHHHIVHKSRCVDCGDTLNPRVSVSAYTFKCF